MKPLTLGETILTRVLCVEDDKDAQQHIGRALYSAGYDVHYAWNGQEGYEKILSLNPDIILLDLILPVMNGAELLLKLREKKATLDIPVIVMTGLGDTKSLLACSLKALGAVAYLSKPVNDADLVGTVKNTIRQFPRTRCATVSLAPQELRKEAIRAEPKYRTVWINDRLIAILSYKEFSLLKCLMKSRGPVGRKKLLRVLGYKAGQGDALKQIIHRLREALGPSESHRLRNTPEGYELLG